MEQRAVPSVKNALNEVPVPAILLEGVPVLRVKVNGEVQSSFLTLSPDKFTLYITTQKVSSDNGGDWAKALSRGLRRMTTKSASSSDLLEERSIDIGAMDRIQRGQVTHKFELARKSRQDSRRNLMSRTGSSRGLLGIGSGASQQDVSDLESITTTASNMTSPSFAKSTVTMKTNDTLAPILNPSKSFSIIFRGARTMDLMLKDDDAEDDEFSRDAILDALDNLVDAYQQVKLKVANEVLLLKYIWNDVDKEKTNRLNVNELTKVMDRINFYMKKNELNKMYEKFCKIIGLDRSQRRKGLTFEQCCTFLHKIKRDSWMVKPVNVIWNDLFGECMNNGKQRSTVSDKSFLEQFLHKKQGDTSATITQVRQLFAKLHEMELPNVVDLEPRDVTRIDKNRFEAYLFGRDNAAFAPSREAFNVRTMTRSISEYWINSSHNTYLTGDQFTSHSSVEMYMNSLYRGCRCLELDIWDGDWELDPQGNPFRPIPVVWHGHTMTSKILFVDIIKCLKVFLNFHPDTYPLVLSFENHCSIPFQEVMAEELVRVLGSKLYIPTESSLFGRLPSPTDLRGLVVIKGRRPDGSIDDNLESDDEGDSDDDDFVSNTGTSRTGTAGSVASSAAKSAATVKKISPALARLTLFHGCKLKNMDTSVRSPTHYMHSFSENKVKKLCRQNKGLKWAIYNQAHMSRTYPAGSRVDSSNYNPMLAWSTGCQLVALNFQTPDAPLKLNDGRFRENGNCGYVLKPSSLMIKDDLSATAMPVKLSVRVLCGSCLPKPKGQRAGDCIDPFVKVSVYDVNEDKESCTTFSTTVVQNNGFFPIWHNAMDKDRFSFQVENTAVAMLHLEVFTKGDMVGQSDEFIANAAIPISCLRQGYRSVQLFDANNTRTGAFDFSSLLIETKLRTTGAEI